MAEDRTRRDQHRPIWHLLVYYVMLVAVAYLLARYVPIFRTILSLQRLQQLSGGSDFDFEAGGGSPLGQVMDDGTGGAIITLVSTLSALAVMIPVAWVYIYVKRVRGYDESVVHAIIILPVAVAGIVIIVQNSLALAFSLAGIVGAVRFRSTLKDTKDAVYIFLALGVGLAAGVQALGVAAVLTVIFNVIILSLWSTNFGNVYADQRGRTGGLGLGDVVAGVGSAETAVSVGDPQLVEAMRPKELKEVALRMARMERYVRTDSDTKKSKRLNSVLIVHAEQLVAAQQAVEVLLEQSAHRWQLAEIIPGEDAVSTLEYLVRLKEDHPPAALLEAIRTAEGARVVAAEFRSLEGLK